MTFPVEIVLKGRDAATTTSCVVGTEPAAWTDADVREALVEILRAVARAEDPASAKDRQIILQGFSWIVEPHGEGVVIAIEIPMGAAVAGPFPVGQAELDATIARVLRAERQAFSAGSTVH
jgi:hypothetical protein